MVKFQFPGFEMRRFAFFIRDQIKPKISKQQQACGPRIPMRLFMAE